MVKTNNVFIIGTLVDVKTDVRTSSENKKYIGGKISVKCMINGTENVLDLRIFAMEKTKNNTDNKMFKSYSTLESLLGQRVRITGSLSEGAMVDESTGDVRHFNQIEAKFINKAYSTDTEDKATFEYAGFVVRPIYERKDKEDNLLGYRIEVAQANYNDTNCVVVRFDISKDDTQKAAVIEANYIAGTTVEFNGTLGAVSTIETKTIEADFGEPTTKTYVKTEKTYSIVSGNLPLDADDENAYAKPVIDTLIAAYKDADAKRVEEKRTKSVDTAPAMSAEAAAMGAITRNARPSLL